MLLIFHALQFLAFHLFGRPAHKKVVDYMNAAILGGWYLTGTTVRFVQTQPLPTDRPIVFVANHQSMFDISPIIWFLRPHTPTFVSKIELAHGIPGISYNLRKSGAALINRNELGVSANLTALWARRDDEILTRKLPLIGGGRERTHFAFRSLSAAGA